jgi:F-type H+-transporting ATPase subunit a
VIEVISYFVRPLSHSIRLAGNMMAGHAVLKVFAAFVPAMSVFGVVPIAAMVGFTALELLVACVQAYIFAILTCVYLNDALHMH